MTCIPSSASLNTSDDEERLTIESYEEISAERVQHVDVISSRPEQQVLSIVAKLETGEDGNARGVAVARELEIDDGDGKERCLVVESLVVE